MSSIQHARRIGALEEAVKRLEVEVASLREKRGRPKKEEADAEAHEG